MIVLIDYNLNRKGLILSGSITSGGWLDIVTIRLVTFADVGLSADSDDRIVWRFVQANQMLLLTANRNAKGEDSLERVMREENTPTSLPIITIGDSVECRNMSTENLVQKDLQKLSLIFRIIWEQVGCLFRDGAV